MTDRAALIRAVLASPDDDTPRLVFADWLDDHGEARLAAFIRDQIECARHANRHELDTYHTFLQWKDAAFAGECALDVWGVAAEFLFPLASWNRGFLESLAWTYEAWKDYATAVLALHPVRRVRLTTPVGDLHAHREFGRILARVAGLAVSVPDDTSGGRDTTAAILAVRWPGIAFELPPAQIFTDAEAAGFRAGYGRESAILNAFLDAGPYLMTAPLR